MGRDSHYELRRLEYDLHFKIKNQVDYKNFLIVNEETYNGVEFFTGRIFLDIVNQVEGEYKKSKSKRFFMSKEFWAIMGICFLFVVVEAMGEHAGAVSALETKTQIVKDHFKLQIKDNKVDTIWVYKNLDK